MKREGIVFSFALLVVVSAIAISKVNEVRESLSDLDKESIEALATDDEIEPIFHKGCIGSGDGCILSPTRYYPTYRGVYSIDEV